MKTCAANTTRSRTPSRGFTLVEVLTYSAILLIVSAVAMKAFFATLDHARDVRRVADDITRALDAGERWRADVRLATGLPRLVEEDGVAALHLPHADGETIYLFDGQTVLRRASPEAPWQPALKAVKHTRFVADQRAHVSGWRWEVELQTRLPHPRIRPQFAFQAVPAQEARR